jgi:ribA/ribD-fused uncharacterized protein
MIDDFHGTPLSNFFRCIVPYEGISYSSAENAYQAAKTLEPGRRKVFAFLSPAQAKSQGKLLPLRGDWERVKLEVMEDIIAEKFKENSPLATYLISTDPHELVEGNYWHDQFWGDCTCSKHLGVPGENHLGKLLMARREALQ